MCLQQLRIKSIKMPFLFAPNMPKQRAGEFLHRIHNSTHLVIGSGTQTREPEGSDCLHKRPTAPAREEQQRQVLADGTARWCAPTQPAWGPELLQLATSRKQQQTTPCCAAWAKHGGSRASREQGYNPVPSELTPAVGFFVQCPCLRSSRLGLKVQSASPLYFHSHFHLECLLFHFKKLLRP